MIKGKTLKTWWEKYQTNPGKKNGSFGSLVLKPIEDKIKELKSLIENQFKQISAKIFTIKKELQRSSWMMKVDETSS